jgi:hypothetical protein
MAARGRRDDERLAARMAGDPPRGDAAGDVALADAVAAHDGRVAVLDDALDDLALLAPEVLVEGAPDPRARVRRQRPLRLRRDSA